MESEFLKLLPQLGLGGILAALVFYFCRQDHARLVEQITDLEKRTAQREEILAQILQRHAAASEALTQSNATVIAQFQTAMQTLMQRLLDEREERRHGA